MCCPTWNDGSTSHSPRKYQWRDCWNRALSLYAKNASPAVNARLVPANRAFDGCLPKSGLRSPPPIACNFDVLHISAVVEATNEPIAIKYFLSATLGFSCPKAGAASSRNNANVLVTFVCILIPVIASLSMFVKGLARRGSGRSRQSLSDEH